MKIRRFHAWNETSEEMAFVFCRSENRFELRRVLFKWHHRTTAAGVGSRRLLMVLVWVSTSHQTIAVNMLHPKWCYRRLPAGEICFPSHQDWNLPLNTDPKHLFTRGNGVLARYDIMSMAALTRLFKKINTQAWCPDVFSNLCLFKKMLNAAVKRTAAF